MTRIFCEIYPNGICKSRWGVLKIVFVCWMNTRGFESGERWKIVWSLGKYQEKWMLKQLSEKECSERNTNVTIDCKISTLPLNHNHRTVFLCMLLLSGSSTDWCVVWKLVHTFECEFTAVLSLFTCNVWCLFCHMSLINVRLTLRIHKLHWS